MDYNPINWIAIKTIGHVNYISIILIDAIGTTEIIFCNIINYMFCKVLWKIISSPGAVVFVILQQMATIQIILAPLPTAYETIIWEENCTIRWNYNCFNWILYVYCYIYIITTYIFICMYTLYIQQNKRRGKLHVILHMVFHSV